MPDLREHLWRMAKYSLLRGGFDATYLSVSKDAYDVDTGTRATSTTPSAVRVALTHYHDKEIDGVAVLRDDMRIYMQSPTGVVPKVGDRLEGLDQTRQIVAVREVFASPTKIPIYVLQARA